MTQAYLPILTFGVSRLAAAITLLISPFHLQAADTPGIMKASTVNPAQMTASELEQEPLSAYYISEKLDGIRAIWTGRQLVTRAGNMISAPDWFTASLPVDIRLDGELWAGRGSFQQVAATVLDHSPNDEQWKKINYMIFDLPSGNETFDKRLGELKGIVSNIGRPHIQLVPQYTVDSPAALTHKLEQVTNSHGEGLMLHHKDNLYRHGRSERLIKLKPHQDAEAVVIGYEEGKGKYQGKMGALWVVTAENTKFKIGTGFTDAERTNPPRLGTIINYRYNGYTDKGIPRFARYIRQRSTPDT